jgi:mono/diheme cytochrome c family protein
VRGRDEARDQRGRSPLRRQPPASVAIAGCLVLAAVASLIAPTGAPIAAQERDALVARGRALFQEKSCHGCHTIGSVGTAIGPDLSQVGGRYREDHLTRWLSPSVQEPTQGRQTQEPTQGRQTHELEPVAPHVSRLLRHMPTPKLSEPEAQALAAHLASLR